MSLKLTRKHNESIQISDDITVTIQTIGNGWVRIAIDAPPEVNIVRAELLNKPPLTALH